MSMTGAVNDHASAYPSTRRDAVQVRDGARPPRVRRAAAEHLGARQHPDAGPAPLGARQLGERG